MSETFGHELWVPTPPGSCKMSGNGTEAPVRCVPTAERWGQLVKQRKHQHIMKYKTGS